LAEASREVLREFERLARQKHLVLEMQGKAWQHAWPVVADQQRVKLILRNLVHNAAKFTSRGHIRLRAIGWHRRHGSIEGSLEVLDSGPGIPAELAAQIFEPLVQGDSSARRLHEGMGLGLTVARRLARRLHGDLEYREHDGEGSCFRWTFSLPVAEGQEAEEQSEAAPPPLSCPRKILIAEDDTDSGLLMLRIVQSQGWQADLVKDGQAAIEHFCNYPYEAILLDLRMPKVDGIQAAREIRRLEAPGKHVPIIAISAYVMDDHYLSIADAGIDLFLEKPVIPNLVIKTLNECFAAQP